MQSDAYDAEHATDHATAAAAFAQASFSILAHRPGAPAAFSRALDADPGMIGPHAARGLAGVLLAREETLAEAKRHLDDAREAARRRTATPFESRLIAALAAAVDGRWRDAARVLDGAQDALSFKFAHALRFLSGDTQGMREAADHACRQIAAAPSTPGAGFILGCRAFALGETGAYAAARDSARRALALEPADAWAAHAYAHACEMTSRPDEGLAWLDQTRSAWDGCNNFRAHVVWHRALMHLETGDAATALALYDSDIRPVDDDFRDFANASSLLMRLRGRGLDVSDRLSGLAAAAARRARDMTLTFAAAHRLLVLLAAGDAAAVAALCDALEKRAREDDDQARAARLAAVPMARLLVDGPQRFAGASALRIMDALALIGGSAAQRDVFVQELARLAAQAGDRAVATRILDIRRRLHADDWFAARGVAA